MVDYKIIIEILSQVFEGKNLTEQFNKNLNKLIVEGNSYYNIPKIKDICYGVMRNYYKIQLILDCLLTRTIKDFKIKLILFIAIYEIICTKKPHFAIVNDSVELSFKMFKQEKLKSFVNAVLRNFLRNKSTIEEKYIKNSEFKFDLPSWWIKKLEIDYPDQYLGMMNTLNLKPKYGLRVNTNKILIDDYKNILNLNDIKFFQVDEKIILESTVNVNSIPLFNEGFVSIQDINAQKLIDLISIEDNAYVLDACCAPGGKMAQILENYNVNLLGIDISHDRIRKVKDTLNRLKLDAILKVADASNLDWWDQVPFDFIIADVPCSASGTVKKNPDIKFHRKSEEIVNFVLTQRKIIINLWQALKTGGILVYITCSIFKEENSQNIEYLKNYLPKFNILNELELLPTEYADGFYYCVVKKI